MQRLKEEISLGYNSIKKCKKSYKLNYLTPKHYLFLTLTAALLFLQTENIDEFRSKLQCVLTLEGQKSYFTRCSFNFLICSNLHARITLKVKVQMRQDPCCCSNYRLSAWLKDSLSLVH